MVDNVIAPGSPAETRLLAIGGFRRDEGLWPRRGLDGERVRALRAVYQEGGPSALPPLRVVKVERCSYLADGWQRCAAAEQLGWMALPAIVTTAARVGDVYLAALAGIGAGERPLSLTRSEKRDAVDRLLGLVPEYSDHAIARMAGVSQPFVSARRRRLPGGQVEKRAAAGTRTPSRHEAGRIVAAAGRLLAMERTGWLCTDGGALDPAAALRAAAQARGPQGDTLLERLGRWIERARRAPAGPRPGSGGEGGG